MSRTELAAAVAVTCACALVGCDRAASRLDRADRSLQDGDTERALTLYEQASVSDDPAVGGRALLAAARVHRDRLGDDDTTENLCEQAAARFPGGGVAADCLLLLAEIREARLDWYGAIDARREFLSQQPAHPAGEEVLDAIARGYVELGNLDQALIEWTELLERYPAGERAATALLGVARCHDLAGDCGMAAPIYQRVRTRFPSAPEAIEAGMAEAGCLEVLGDLGSAEALYRELVEVHPNPDAVRQRLDGLRRSQVIRTPAIR